MAGTEGGGVEIRVARENQGVQGLRIEKGQIAGQDQPRHVRVDRERRADAGDGAFDVAAIRDVRVARTCGVVLLVRAHRNESFRHAPLEQLHRRIELGLAGAKFEGGLVAPHA
jgi:hypothetical protein